MKNLKNKIIRIILKPLGLQGATRSYSEISAYKIIKKHKEWAYVSPDFEETINTSVRINNTIWVFWRQGVENAPDLVKKCIESQKKWAETWGYDYIVLSDNNLRQYIKLPEVIEEKHRKKIIGEANYSDILRSQLLIQYGGIWMDSTCFVTGELPSYIMNAPFFMFSTGNWWPWYLSPSKCSSWFIKSEKGNELLIKTRNFMFEHWCQRNTIMHYFVFHLALSMLTEEDKNCKTIWESMPFVNNLQPHLLLYSFHKPYNNETYGYILGQSFIHKCSYKYQKDLLNAAVKNNLQHFLGV